MLAPWASHPQRSRGRRVAEVQPATRSEFQRDRDRIVHSNAFRRLVYKTQVFVNHEGDLFRTRLTHSLEAAQLGRSMARQLGLEEDLVEAIALAHDLGHTPFGHAGQDALAQCMQAHGGFEHNLQSLRVVDHLEQRYASFDGLNLSFEAREGILKHCSRRHALALEAAEPGGVARRFLEGGQPSLEAQLVNLADEIAYSVHDIDDGIRSGLLTIELMSQHPLFERCRQQALEEQPVLAGPAARRLLAETLRRMLAALVDDVVRQTHQALERARPADETAARQLPPLVGFSAPLAAEVVSLKRLLFANLYRHPQVQRTMDLARQVLAELFQLYLARPHELPADFLAPAHAPDVDGESFAARRVCDYVAGMTDRFALREHQRLTGQDLLGLAGPPRLA